MKLEFLDDISDGGKYPDADPNQLIRLYDFDRHEAIKFRKTINKLIEDSLPVDLSKENYIESINCFLTLGISSTNIGLITTDKKYFACNLTKEEYHRMIYLLEPFCEKESSGYQWLYDLNTPIDFLFSQGGTW